MCDLGPSDGVCAVQWTREGSYVSIGTSNGQVQVRLCNHYLAYKWIAAMYLGVGYNSRMVHFGLGMGWYSMQKDKNHGRPSNKSWCSGMEFAHFIFWEQRQEHPST